MLHRLSRGLKAKVGWRNKQKRISGWPNSNCPRNNEEETVPPSRYLGIYLYNRGGSRNFGKGAYTPHANAEGTDKMNKNLHRRCTTNENQSAK